MEKDELAKNHRWFAVECNNSAWDLAAKPTRSADENEEMLLAAHAAAFHWSKVGQPINRLRAWLLLAHVHSLLGHGAEAARYANQCLEFCDQHSCEDWDRAFTHAEMAFAATVQHDRTLHARHYQTAKRLGDALHDAEERTMFRTELARLPIPE